MTEPTPARKVDPRLDDMVNVDGIDQHHAGRLLWGRFSGLSDPGDPDTYPADAPLPWATAWVRARARVIFAGWMET